MSEKDVVENVDSPGEISIPIANNDTPGIASFDFNDFTVGPDGKVSSIVERGIPQYLGKITGTGTGTTDLNWEVDTNTVKQNKPIKLGEYIMLTAHFNQFVPGDIFRITSVQIEGSKYTVKTNNVKVLSLASIVGPQGEQGNEGEQGVPYLAYTNSIESTADPVPSALMYLDDGHFNRTPIATSDTYRDVVTVDWYNKTTHRAFMVTGLIQGKNNATNQWVADITAATDITGAEGPQGKEGAGIADIVDIDYPHGDFTSVQYDTTDGIRMQGIAEYLRNDGETYEIPTDIDVPLVAGAGISIDKKENEEKVEVKSDINLEKGIDDILVQTNDANHSFKVMKDGRAKVQTAPKESTDVVRLEDLKNVSPTIVDLGKNNSITSADYTKLENNENALLIYDGVIYRRSRGTNYGYDEMQFESIDDSVQTATIYITNCVVTAADEAAGVISVTDTAGLKVGMTIMFTTSGGSVLLGISYRKIASIDTENKKIAMDGIVIDSDTLTDGSFIAVKANATSINLTNCVVTTADEAAGVISVTDGKSLTIGMYIDFRTSGGSRLAGISNRKIIAKDTANNKITVSGTVIDSDTLTNGCYITLANDIGFNKIYNRVLRIGKQKPDSTTAYIRYAYIPIGGLPITPSTATSSATSGTFTDSEWSKLQANDNNYILFNNEIYRLADKAHSGTTGIWSYTHTGWDGTAIMDKSINVTVSTGAWTLVVGQASGGGKLYSYKYAGALSQSGSHGMPTVYVYFQFYLPYLIEINTYEKFRSICEKVYGKDTYIPVTFHRVGLDAYYSGAFRFYKSSADNYVRFFFCGITSDSLDTNPAIFAYYTDANALIPPAADDVNKQWSDVVNLTVTEV